MKVNQRVLIVAGIVLVLFLTIALSIRLTGYFLFDAQLSNEMAERVPGSYVSWFTQIGSGVGAVTITSILAIMSYLIWRDKVGCIWYFVTCLSVGVLNQVVKLIFVRDRPSLNDLVGGVGYSFPSGHSSMAFAVYGGFIVLAWRFLSRTGRIVVSTVCTLMVLAMGSSRIILNVHYFSDVLGGFLFAAFVLSLSYAFVAPRRKKEIYN
ncbi:phosphatase PAP2 family protein [Exiguobacterium antarcticum]|uniref:Phosphatase PAP2 family protein n=1 Tax=Exiguobacterium antarcticum TaxID=132920 RepID=A0ABT6R0W1_9BACL|nr:phosphatase PAP2 family protein [Exiguobacterium antarcticum]MDI3234577.1 phosphatase PAP2 family protein [Exiguobacterium antarcticum]